MNFLDFKIGIVWFLLSFIVLPVAGFVFRSAQLQKKERRIKELEGEMVSSHSEILALQEQLFASKMNVSKTAAVKENGLVVENVSKTKLKVSAM